jgi:hypothetical protein
MLTMILSMVVIGIIALMIIVAISEIIARRDLRRLQQERRVHFTDCHGISPVYGTSFQP